MACTHYGKYLENTIQANITIHTHTPVQYTVAKKEPTSRKNSTSQS